MKFIIALALLAGTIALAGCGRIGDPLPPIRHRALVPEVLQITQRGDALVLSWPKPGTVLLETSSIVRAEVLRRDEKASEPQRLPEDKFLEEAHIVGTVTSRQITEMDSRTVQFADHLSLNALTQPDLRYRYAIRYVNIAGTPFPLSGYAFVEPETRISQPPTDLNIELSNDAIKLTWQAPTANLDTSSPAAAIGYNIYRRAKKDPLPDKPLNMTPINKTTFEDRQFKFGPEYIYVVRSLSQGKEHIIESPNSQEASVKAIDTFAPATPANVTGAAAAGVVNLFWPANKERDLKGYNVYRGERRTQAREEWSKLTPMPITTTTFRDEKAPIGKTYFYFITAIDEVGNESAPSEGTEVEVVQ
jgi:hypothetical protein